MPTPQSESIQNTYYSGYAKAHVVKLSVTCSSMPDHKRVWAIDCGTPKTSDIDAMRDMNLTMRIKGNFSLMWINCLAGFGTAASVSVPHLSTTN